VYIFEVSGNADQCNTSPAHTREKGIDMIKVSVVATVTLELEVDLVGVAQMPRRGLPATSSPNTQAHENVKKKTSIRADKTCKIFALC
jgi:hypothetical protein